MSIYHLAIVRSQSSTTAITSTSSALRYPWKKFRSIFVPALSSSRIKQAPLSFFTHPISMSSTTLFRFVARTQPSCFLRSSTPVRRLSPPRSSYRSPATAIHNNFSTSARRAADQDGQGATGGSGHQEESFEEFTARYTGTGLDPRKCSFF